MKVLILGLGQYPQGSGVAAALYFARRGDEVTVTDLKTAKELKVNVAQLKKFKNVRFVLGRHDINDVRQADLVVRNPRIRSNSPEIQEAKKRGLPIESDISLFLEKCPARVIGITGTRGKSTTTTLIAEMLKSKIQKPKSKTWLGGNILVSPLMFLNKVKPDDWVVLELSSWQLEATGEKGISPSIAVWTNLMRDHLNTYSGMDDYAEAKAQIFRHQGPDGLVFLPADKSFDPFAKAAAGRVIRFGKKSDRAARLVKSVKLKMLGAHNVTNAIIAATVALELGVPVSAIKKVLRSFVGLPNRLEVVKTIKGVRFINDTTATTPDATIAAVKALKGEKIYLIFGGADKELEFDEVAKVLKRASPQIYLLPGTAHEKIIKAFRSSHVAYRDVKDMKDAMRAIKKAAKRGDTILLSPGCASFGLFKNEFDRGEKFKRLVG